MSRDRSLPSIRVGADQHLAISELYALGHKIEGTPVVISPYRKAARIIYLLTLGALATLLLAAGVILGLGVVPYALFLVLGPTCLIFGALLLAQVLHEFDQGPAWQRRS